MNDTIQRELQERTLRARSNVTLAFRTLALAAPLETYVQGAFFDTRTVPDGTVNTCTHVGTRRDEQMRLDGSTVVLCVECGCEAIAIR